MVEPHEDLDRALHESNRLVHRVADAELARRRAAKRMWGAASIKEEEKAKVRYQRASNALDEAAAEYEAFCGRVVVLKPEPEDWPA